ncbi:MAG: hypothetical protein KJ655_01935 [Candidatus Thermoplasmatota archaeon]|nr:hypothetical protein [Candidatus Thermoplasmatota archaeon]
MSSFRPYCENRWGWDGRRCWEQVISFQGAEAQEEDAEKIPEKTLFLIYTTAMYGMKKTGWDEVNHPSLTVLLCFVYGVENNLVFPLTFSEYPFISLLQIIKITLS